MSECGTFQHKTLREEPQVWEPPQRYDTFFSFLSFTFDVLNVLFL